MHIRYRPLALVARRVGRVARRQRAVPNGSGRLAAERRRVGLTVTNRGSGVRRSLAALAFLGGEQQGERRAGGDRPPCVCDQSRRDRLGVDDREAPVVERDPLGKSSAQSPCPSQAIGLTRRRRRSSRRSSGRRGRGRSAPLQRPRRRWCSTSSAKTSSALATKRAAPSGWRQAPRPRTWSSQRSSRARSSARRGARAARARRRSRRARGRTARTGRRSRRRGSARRGRSRRRRRPTRGSTTIAPRAERCSGARSRRRASSVPARSRRPRCRSSRRRGRRAASRSRRPRARAGRASGVPSAIS